MRNLKIIEYKNYNSWSYYIVIKDNKKYMIVFSKYGTTMIKL